MNAPESQRAEALVLQFRNEFDRRRRELVRTVNAIAASDAVRHIAIQPDTSEYYDYAAPQAATHDLDLLELVAADGAIVSSAQWPARFGYKEEWLTTGEDWKLRGAFLRREELPQGVTLALVAVAIATEGDRRLYVVGGQQLDREFLSTLVLPAGMRVMLYRNLDAHFTPSELIDAAGPCAGLGVLAPFDRAGAVGAARTFAHRGQRRRRRKRPRRAASGARQSSLGVLLIASSRRDLVELENSLLRTGIIVAAAGILLGVALSWWAAARVTRPVHRLADSAGRVAAGDWNTTVDVSSADEIGQLARAFNRMTRELVAQRERLVQAERVAAWRELARRLAHELKNPLFPLQITVENMLRARDRYPGTVRRSLPRRHRHTAGRAVPVEADRRPLQRFRQDAGAGDPAGRIQRSGRGDAQAVRRPTGAGTRSRVTALDPARPQGAAWIPSRSPACCVTWCSTPSTPCPRAARSRVRTVALGAGVRLEISDTGQGLTPEECARLFTPYYTTKTHGTGLGLAIVQSVVSDHGGRISVESEQGRGSTFRIELSATSA